MAVVASALVAPPKGSGLALMEQSFATVSETWKVALAVPLGGVACAGNATARTRASSIPDPVTETAFLNIANLLRRWRRREPSDESPTRRRDPRQVPDAFLTVA